MRIAAVVVVIWLVVGLVAAFQRDYFSGGDANCAEVSTTAVTIVAGPLNYVGANPEVDCDLPQPSD